MVVTKGSKQKHMNETLDVLTKLENAGYRPGEGKSDIRNRSRMDRSQNRSERYQTVTRKTAGNKGTEKSKNEKELKSFLGGIQ